jgi:hypothetical protein
LSSNQANGEAGPPGAALRVEGALRERKKGVLEVAGIHVGIPVRATVRARAIGNLVEGAFAAHAAGAQEHEAIAEARSVGDLMD